MANDKFQEFMRESREEKWISKLEAHPNSANKWGDNVVWQDICISIDYLTLDRILKCECDELEHIEAILGGIASSSIMYDPRDTLKGLKQGLVIYPEQLRKRRILVLDDGAATYAFLAEREIKRGIMLMLPISFELQFNNLRICYFRSMVSISSAKGIYLAA